MGKNKNKKDGVVSMLTRVSSQPLVICFCFLLLVFFLVRAWHFEGARSGLDFYQLWAPGKAIAHIYEEDTRKKIGLEFFQKAKDSNDERLKWVAEKRKDLEAYQTPFLYTVFHILLSRGEFDRDFKIYYLFCIACSIFSIATLGRVFKYSSTAIMLSIIILITLFGPFFSDVVVGNVNQIQLALLALFLWFQSRYKWRMSDFCGGFIIGLAILFKFNLIFVVLMLSISWLVNRRFRKFILEYAGIMTAIVSSFIISGILVGSMWCWIDWFKTIMTAPESMMGFDAGNFGLAMLIFHWFKIKISAYLIGFFLILSIVFVWFNRKERDDIYENKIAFYEDIIMVGIGCLIYLVSVKMVWLHYFILTIPMAMFMLRPFNSLYPEKIEKALVRYIFGIIAVLAIAVNPIRILLGIKELQYGYVSLLVNLGSLILFIFAVRELKNIKRLKLQ